MERMPALFIGHGNPMNAIEENEFSQAWEEAGKALPRPRAILCISAHWETDGPQVTAMSEPRTIYDFYGFPPELYAATYPAPGSLDLAERVRRVVKSVEVQPDLTWGLDHGTWSVLKRLFPRADVPVVQFSLDAVKDMQRHYDLGKQLRELREDGILIIGSGNIVHNLRMVNWGGEAYSWATDFDEKVRQWIVDDDHQPIIEYQKHGQQALLSVNSAEHYEPLLYILA
ncbi:4,5-DOPA dioxygenase extradiol, partial [bacterium]|nr:4,5-DOPA dioxygenase extradiol [bacterium]